MRAGGGGKGERWISEQKGDADAQDEWQKRVRCGAV